MPKLLIFDAFMLLIREKNVANYALLGCNNFSLKNWKCKRLDKFHVWAQCAPSPHWILDMHKEVGPNRVKIE